MATYRYTAIDENGKKSSGTMEAQNVAGLFDALAASGLYCVSYDEKEQKQLSSGGLFAKKLNTKDLMMFCRQLGIMVHAGMQLPDAMGILSERAEDEGLKRIYADLHDRIHSGMMMSAAMREQGKAFPIMLVQMVEAAELSGTMDEMLANLADYYDREKVRNGKIKSALTYPIVLVITMILVIGALFLVVMPRLLPMFGAGQISPGMHALLDITEFLTTKWYVLIIAAVVILVLRMVLRSIPPVRLAFDKLALHFPVIGKLRATVYVGRFCEAFATLYRSGVPVSQSLQMSAATIINTYFNDRCIWVRTQVDAGGSLSENLNKSGLFDSMFCSMLHVGEESGEMEEVLNRLAVFYDREGSAAIDRAVELIQPAFIIILGGVVGTIIAIIISSLYSMFSMAGI